MAWRDLSAFFIFSIVKSWNDYSCIAKRRNIYFLFMLCIHVSVYSQENFSPRLKKQINHVHADDVFSIGVKDSSQFFKQYGSKVILQRKYRSANILSVKTSSELVLKQMALDGNIVFIDRHRK